MESVKNTDGKLGNAKFEYKYSSPAGDASRADRARHYNGGKLEAQVTIAKNDSFFDILLGLLRKSYDIMIILL